MHRSVVSLRTSHHSCEGLTKREANINNSHLEYASSNIQLNDLRSCNRDTTDAIRGDLTEVRYRVRVRHVTVTVMSHLNNRLFMDQAEKQK